MSYKYGLNGNDLNWDMILTVGMSEFCVECEENLHYAIICVKDELSMLGFLDAESADDILEIISNDFYDHTACDGHTTCYYRADSEYTTEEIIQAGGIEKLAEYGIFHDTNDNFVDTFGDVPNSIFTEKYIAERNEAEAE